MGKLEDLAALLRQRNTIANQITAIIDRPAQIGHIGEFIASEIFGRGLAGSAVHKGSDGVFNSGPLRGKTVNIKWYAKKENVLDIREDALPDYYLVLTGPQTKVMTSRSEARLWSIDSVFLFEARSLIHLLRARGVMIGIATSVAKEHWEKAEIHPSQNNKVLILRDDQREMLRLFATEALGV